MARYAKVGDYPYLDTYPDTSSLTLTDPTADWGPSYTTADVGGQSSGTDWSGWTSGLTAFLNAGANVVRAATGQPTTVPSSSVVTMPGSAGRMSPTMIAVIGLGVIGLMVVSSKKRARARA